MSEHMIEMASASFGYRRGSHIFHDVSLALESGHCVAVLGNNGAGKSTLLRCINRILKLESGQIAICGQALEEYKRRALAQTVSYVEQNGSAEEYTVYDMILLGRKPYFRVEPRREDLDIVEETIARMGLQGYELRQMSQLSGGERQKVMLARALSQQPRVLLLDEPTSNLDLHNQHEVMDLVSTIAREDHILVVVVIHDLNLAVRYCDRFVLLHQGGIYAMGDDSILTEETLSHVYGIHARIVTVEGEKIVLSRLEKTEITE